MPRPRRRIPKATDTRTAAATVEELVLADGTRLARPIAYADANSNVVYVDRTEDTTDAGADASPSPDEGDDTRRIARLVWVAARLPADAVDVTTEVIACPAATQRLESAERCSGDVVPERWTVTATLRRVRRDSYRLTVDHPRVRARVDVGWTTRVTATDRVPVTARVMGIDRGFPWFARASRRTDCT
ncbi:MAG: hypothetical protein IPK71_11650 [Myxococcales bacterium]|nr:hypothetical protein [Myxococcales bacterium]